VSARGDLSDRGAAPARPHGAARDPRRPAHAEPRVKNPTAWKGFRTAAWLGWQIESNWADPLLFSIYSVAKPLGAAGIVVVMYAVITRGNFGSPLFPCLYVGQAFYLYVASLMSGISFGVIDDRERYRTLKYVYVAPPPAWL